MNLVPLRQLADHRAFGMLGAGLLQHRVVIVGVKRFAQRREGLDAVLGQDGQKLLLNHLQSRADAFGRRGSQRVGCAFQVVDGLEQVVRQVADGVGAIRVCLLFGALLIIGELGTVTEQLIAQVVSLFPQLLDLLLGRSESPAARGDRPPSLFWSELAVNSSRWFDGWSG